MDVHTDRLNINGDWKLPEKISPSAWSVNNVVIAEGNNRPGRISYTDLAYQPEIIDSAEQRVQFCHLHGSSASWKNFVLFGKRRISHTSRAP